MPEDEYVPVEQVAELLRVSTRHAHRACQKANVRTRQAGKRRLYCLADVDALVVALGVEYRSPEPVPIKPEPTSGGGGDTAGAGTDVVLASDLLRHMRDLETTLARIAHQNGQLEAERDRYRDERDKLEVELAALRAGTRRRWWQFWRTRSG